MKAQYDYLTLILPFNGKEKETIKEMQGDVEVKFIHQDYLTYHLQQGLDGLFNEKRFGYFQSFDYNKEIFIIKNKQYEIHFRGKFFLRDGLSLFFEIYGKIIELGYVPHISRLDVCFTGEGDFQTLSRMLMKSDFKNLEVISRKKKNKFTYINARNVRFEFLAYPKSSHLKRLKDKEYIERFYERYGRNENLSRIEVRLHNKYNLEKLTDLLLKDPESFFKQAFKEVFCQIKGRIRLPRKVSRTIVQASNELGLEGPAQGSV